MTRRVKVDLDLHLSITLDGDPKERTLAYNAFLDDALETIQRLGARYYLRAHKGESVEVRVSDECETTDLPPHLNSVRRRRAREGTATRAAAARPEAADGRQPRPLRLVAGGNGMRDQRDAPVRARRRRGPAPEGERALLVTHSASAGHALRNE